MNRSFDSPPQAGSLSSPSLSCLLYRFMFFGWLFEDLNQARNLFERRALWQHNRAMRKYLPIYLRRWASLFVVAFLFGWLCEKSMETVVLAACCYAGSCMTVPVMAVIAVAWLFLSRSDMPWQR
jgi:high-affinity nickel permease